MTFRNYCTFEDRPEALMGVKLLALSLEKHCSDFCFWLVLRRIPAGLGQWVRHYAPHTRLLELTPRQEAWNIKAYVLSHFLNTAVEEIIWIDSDIIVLRDLEPLWLKAGSELVVAQEYDYPSLIHKRQISTFGEETRRPLPYAVNSCVLRFSRSELPILDRWNRYLENERYREEQDRPFAERALGLRGDQDVLEYTLSTIDHPAAVSPSYVRTGTEIIQDHGSTTYDLLHRFKNALGLGRPFFVHALGAKPWSKGFSRRDSAYVAYAQPYSEHLDVSLRDRRSGVWARLLPPEIMAHLAGSPRCAVGKGIRFLTTGSFRRPLDAESRPRKSNGVFGRKAIDRGNR